jgi:hypothetical protein
MLLALITVFATGLANSPLELPVHPIVTEFSYADGHTTTQRGLGFVVDQRFITVYHNIEPPHAQAPLVATSIELDGYVVQPAYINPAHDIAVFELPAELCRRWCANEYYGIHEVPPAATAITWPAPKARSWSQAHVGGLVVKGERTQPFGSCQDNMVFSVDAPFIPGSSGGPVVDQNSGLPIGVVQGSFTYASGETKGYFKPLRCVYELMSKAPMHFALLTR